MRTELKRCILVGEEVLKVRQKAHRERTVLWTGMDPSDGPTEVVSQCWRSVYTSHEVVSGEALRTGWPRSRPV